VEEAETVEVVADLGEVVERGEDGLGEGVLGSFGEFDLMEEHALAAADEEGKGGAVWVACFEEMAGGFDVVGEGRVAEEGGLALKVLAAFGVAIEVAGEDRVVVGSVVGELVQQVVEGVSSPHRLCLLTWRRQRGFRGFNPYGLVRICNGVGVGHLIRLIRSQLMATMVRSIVVKTSYKAASAEFLEERGLKRHAGVWQLWALGVGAVISGDFFGWNFGLAAGGFGGMILALVVVTLMYVGLCLSIAEMAAALPHTGGAYSFARSAMGPWGGYVTGLAENMEYILTPAVIVVGIGGYLGAIFGTGKEYEPLWWLICYALFVALNVWGVELSFRFSLVITVAALVALVTYWVSVAPQFDLARYAAPYFPKGVAGFWACLPFALWFYLAIEQLPLAAEESHDPVADIPRGLSWGLATLVVCAFLTLTLGAGSAPGASAVAVSNEPLFLGFVAAYGNSASSKLLAVVACVGLIASFHTILFAYGRQIYSLSRAGYFPVWLSKTHPVRKTPHRALVAGAALGFAAALAIHYAPHDSPVGAILLNMAVFGAVIAYVLQMASYVLLRWRMQSLERPYRSPLGVFGAVVSGLIALTTLGTLFANAEYVKGVYGAVVWFAVGLAWFAFYARHQLILSPEEEFARARRGEQ